MSNDLGNIDVQNLVDLARDGNLGTDNQAYQRLQTLGRNVQTARNALDEIRQAGGARTDVGTNPVI